MMWLYFKNRRVLENQNISPYFQEVKKFYDHFAKYVISL